MRKTNQHLLFWIIVFVLLNALFGSKWSSLIDSFYFTSMLMPVATGTAYFFNLWLVPKYLNSKRYFLFALYCVYILIVSFFLSQLVILGAFALLANFEWNDLDPLVKDVFQLEVVVYLVVLLFGFIQVYQNNLVNRAAMDALAKKAETNLQETITVRSNRVNVNIRLNEVNYIESLSDYVKIWSGEEPIVTREKISHLQEKLPDFFIRCHRSYLVNANKVDSVTYESLVVAGQEIPIGRKYKPEVDKLRKN